MNGISEKSVDIKLDIYIFINVFKLKQNWNKKLHKV